MTKPRIVSVFVAVLMAAGLSVPATVLTPAVAGPAPIRLKVMSFNIQYGASYSTLEAVVKAIRAADADVVGIQEAYGKTARIAKMLGWYASPSMHMVSRFPIVRPGGSTVAGSPGGRIPDGMVAYLLLGDGAVAAIAQTHTPWTPNGMQAMMQGAGPAEVAAREQGKINWLAPHLEALAQPIADGLPTFFVGDLNSPSHLDWTPEAVEALGMAAAVVAPAGRPVCLRLARHGRDGGRRVPRFLPGDAPRPDRRPGVHVLHRPVPGVRTMGHVGPHRLRRCRRPQHDRAEPGRR